jgi:hypothetical protein
MLFPEHLSSTPIPSVLLRSVAGKSDEGDGSRETFNDSHVDSHEEDSVTQNVDIQTIGERHEETEENNEVSIPVGDRSSGREPGKEIVTEIAVPDAPIDDAEVPVSTPPSLQEHSNGTESKETDVSTYVNATSAPISSISSCTPKTVSTIVTVASTSPVATFTVTATTENSVGGSEKNVCDLSVGSPQGDDAKIAPSSPKCRIPVRLGEPVCLKSSVQEADDLLEKPSTFTQDKPAIGDSVFAPTPQRPGRGSPTSATPVSSKYAAPKSPTSAPRTGTKIPSLLPSVSHGIGKADIRSHPQNTAPSSSGKISSPDSKFPSPPASLNQGGPDVSVGSVLSNSWSSPVSEAESLSDSVSATKIPQPGFYSGSPFSLQSSKRGSFTSQLSGSSRPGSIAPSLNTSLDSSTSHIMKEAGYNYINKPRLSATDHNLNISSKIPTVTSPPSSHLNPLSSFSSLEGSALHGNSKSALSNEQSPLVSRIPTLTSPPTSPSSTKLDSVSQRLFSTPASEGSQRTSLESPGRQAKTWMFGPHKNATVVSANSGLKLLIV